MRSKLFLFAFFAALLIVPTSVIAQKPSGLKVVTPQAPFDFKVAADMINIGKSSIKGKAFFETRAGIIRRKIEDDTYARPGSIITLYPVTPYMAEFLELRKRDKRGKQMASVSREVHSFRLETKVYTQTGDFAFFGLQPGKYFISTYVNYTSGIGGYEVWGVVEIKTDGETVEAVIKDKFENKNSLF